MKILEVTNVDFALQHFILPVMQALREAGHEVHGVCADGPAIEGIRRQGFTVHTLPIARSFSPKEQWRSICALWRLFRREKPDIVHAHMPISGVLARCIAWVCGVRIIAYTGHGFIARQPGPAWRKGLGIAVEWCAGRVTDRYMTVSQSDAEFARRYRFHSSPVAIGNGRSPQQYYPDREARRQIRRSLDVAEETMVIVMVARLVRHKGFVELLRAFEDVPKSELWIIGERLPSDHGDNLDTLFADSQKKYGTRLRLLGGRYDVARYLAAADVAVLPSHFEGLPMVIIEAMLCALPVVATAIPGPEEQIVDGETGFLVPVGESAPLARALTWLIQHPDRARRMGKAGRVRAEKLYDEKDVLARVVSCVVDSGTSLSS